MDARQCERAALLEGRKGHRDQFAGRREEHRTVKGHRWSIGCIPGGRGAELEGKPARRLPSGQHMDLVSLGERQLGGEVGAGTEAIDPQAAPRRQLRPLERAVADDSRAQQRREARSRAPERAARRRTPRAPRRTARSRRRRPTQ